LAFWSAKANTSLPTLAPRDSTLNASATSSTVYVVVVIGGSVPAVTSAATSRMVSWLIGITCSSGSSLRSKLK
jgi:hypothetical protein